MILRFFAAAALALSLASLASAETKLCAKKTAPVINGSVKLGSLVTSTTGACPAGTKTVLRTDTAAQTLAALLGVDGSGSSLDADTLDGSTKADFALASSLTSLESTVNSLGTTSTNHETRIDAVEDETRVQNVVRVGVTGGDFTSIADAISSLSNPSTSNPYLVIVGPGTFTLASPLIIPGGVTLRGTGIDRTIVAASINAGTYIDAAVLRLTNGAAIEDLTVKNTSTANSFWAIGVYLGPTITESNKANIANFDTVVRGVRVHLSASGSATHYGIYSIDSDAMIVRSLIDVDGSSVNNTGIIVTSFGSSTLHVYNSNLYVANAASTSRGVDISDALGGTPELFLHDTKIYAEKNALVLSGTDAKASLFNSVLSANTSSGTAISLTNGTVVVNNSSIDAFDNVTNSGGVLSCAFVTEVNGGGYSSSCE